MSLPKREEIEEEYRWDLSSIFTNSADWEEEYQRVSAQISDLTSYSGADIETPEDLVSVLESVDDISKRCGRLFIYAKLKNDENTADADSQERLGQIHALFAKLDDASDFIEPVVREIDEQSISEHSDAETYEHYLADIRRRSEYAPPDSVQSVLADLKPVLESPDSIFTTFINQDYRAPTIQTPENESISITPNNYRDHLRHSDRDFRKTVFSEYQSAISAARHLLTDSFVTMVDRNVELANIHGYDSARQAALDENSLNEIHQALPEDVHDTLISATESALEPYHRYYKIKQERLEVNELRPWDRFVPLPDSETPEIPYEQAKQLIIEAVAPLGEEYQSRLRSYLEKRRVDVYETQQKSSEALAYSFGVYETDPYLFLNYTPELRSVFILAHELGHAMHYLYANETQPRIYGGFQFAVSELPSNLHEVLLAKHLLNVEDRNIREHGLDSAIRRFEEMFYRHAILARFTHWAHTQSAAGAQLTVTRLEKQYTDVVNKFQAPIRWSENSGQLWLGDNQSYRLYLSYPYVIGRAAAHTVATRVVTGEMTPATYTEFLKAGASKYPTELLADIDITIRSAELYDHATSEFTEYLTEFEY